MLMIGGSGLANYLTVEQYRKLLSVRLKKEAILPKVGCRL